MTSEDTAPSSPDTDRPHSTQVVVWDVPPTVEVGAPFRIKLGVKCSGGCRAANGTVEVRDHDGVPRAVASVGGEPWPGTEGLHFAEVELPAPDREGLHAWEAEGRVNGSDAPHAPSVTTFNVRAVPTPDCLLRVVAVDFESGNPVEGVRVVAHPYRAVTDDAGVAELRLPSGDYRLFVSGRKYSPYRHQVAVQADVTLRAELALEPELTDADIWS